jgi:dolichyl-phosphate-mannose--protein O-mannosyl transferase
VGWFLSKRGWDRQFSENAWGSWWHYHAEMLGFHTGLTEKHSYQANPWSWLVMGRPTSFFYESPQNCGSKNCAQEVLAIGTPILWWVGTIAIVVVFGFWIRAIVAKRFDSVLNIVVLGISAGYLPWFFFQKRTVFTFYAVIFEPFMLLAIVYCAKLLLDSSMSPAVSMGIVSALLILIFLNFVYFLPLFTGEVINYSDWLKRMWLSSWI